MPSNCRVQDAAARRARNAADAESAAPTSAAEGRPSPRRCNKAKSVAAASSASASADV